MNANIPNPSNSPERPTSQTTNQTKSAAFCPEKYALLLVDDDEDQRAYFEAFLRGKGFQVFTSATARQALGLLRQIYIDVLITDLRMPGANGFDFIDYIRKHNATQKREIPIILLTGSHESLELAALEVGADMFCQKQNAAATLVKQIQYVLRDIPGL